MMVGASVHAKDEAVRCAEQGADFLLAGTLFTTPSHPEVNPSGVGWIEALRSLGIPVIGIGGIAVEQVAEVCGAGAYGVAVIRAVWDAPSPTAAAARLLEAVAAANRVVRSPDLGGVQ